MRYADPTTGQKIGRIVRNAVVFDFKRHGTLAMDPESLLGTVESLFDTLMQAFAPDTVPLLAELSRHLSASDLAEVQAIVAELQGRIDRFGRAFQSG